MAECLIPPWVRPESPETIRIIDDATVAFQPAFGRGMTQRGVFADPRWGLRRRYRGLRSDEKAAILNALNETRGQLNVLRVTPHTPLRGSFSAAELLSNGTFSNGTTGWTANADYTLSAADRTLRATRNACNGANVAALYPSATVAATQYAPYVARFMVKRGRGNYPTGFRTDIGSSAGGAEYGAGAGSFDFGMQTAAAVATSTTIAPRLMDRDNTGLLAGDYLAIPYASLARCALVDGGQNLLLQSDDLNNVAYTKTRATVTSSAATAPDGSGNGDRLVEDTSNNTHFSDQSVTVSSAQAAYCYGAYVAGSRGWVALQIASSGGSVTAYFNTSTGAVGATFSDGGTWTRYERRIVNAGSGWYLCFITGIKLNSDVTVSCRVYAASADGTNSFTGNTGQGVLVWRQGLIQSAAPSRLIQTTSSAVSSTSQPAGGCYTKGWPASTNGLLLSSDWTEINGELKQLTAPVNSDAAGLAFMQFSPGLAGAPADNDPIIVFEPFGRFLYPGTREIENMFGIYGDCEMNLEEVYS